MRSLSQDATDDALPDFRNLGVVARILVLVNGLAFVAAAVRASDFTQLVEAFLEIALLLEPILITSLLALYVANAGLARLPYASAVAVVLGMVLLLTAAAYLLQPAGDATPAGLRAPARSRCSSPGSWSRTSTCATAPSRRRSPRRGCRRCRRASGRTSCSTP
ncbi:MAG: hypothetical protein M5U08_03495 [Burkholderiales bacterium]|nr:hypothetical protein [Burkholderiales bacterium]